MDIMKMDERQRLAWFMANRGTLLTVGAVWIGMIGWELTHGRMPSFLLIMVPVFALLRAGLYRWYCDRPFVEDALAAEPLIVRWGKRIAAALLLAAALLPVYRVEDFRGATTETASALRMAIEDPVSIVPLAVAFLWPFGVLGLARLRSRRLLQAALLFIEPVLAVASSIVVLWIPQLIISSTPFLFFMLIPAEAKPGWGCYLAVTANGLFLVSWLAELLRPSGAQETAR
jgi:hypothetical protein